MRKVITGLIFVGIVFFSSYQVEAGLFGRRANTNTPDCDGGRCIRPQPKPTPDVVKPVDKVAEINTIIQLKKEIAELKKPAIVEPVDQKVTIPSAVAVMVGILIGSGIFFIGLIKDIKKGVKP